MGSILAAVDGKLGREVAIKVMSLDANAEASMRRRFLREAEVLAMLAHPNIVPIYDIVWEDGLPLFYSMKMVKGRTLQAILNDLRKEEAAVLREYSLERLLVVFRKICDAMAFAHSKGVLHRDLKPENVMVGEFGEGYSCNFLSDTVLLARGDSGLIRYDVSEPQGPVNVAPGYQRHYEMSEAHPASGLFAMGRINPGIPSLVKLMQLTPEGVVEKWEREMPEHTTYLGRQTLSMDFDAPGEDQIVVILDADTLEEKHRFRAHDEAITALRFHPSERVIATGSMDYSVKLWDYVTAEVKRTFDGLGGRPVMLSFSPNGRLLAVEGMEKAFRVYEVE